MSEVIQIDFSSIKTNVLKRFKDILKEYLRKFDQVEFIELWKLTCLEFGIPVHCHLKDEVELWFNNIYNHQFINHLIIKTHNLREIIIHSPHFAQIQSEQRVTKGFDWISIEDYQLSLEILATKNNCEWNHRTPFISFSCQLCELNFRVSLCHFSTQGNKISRSFFRTIEKNTFHINEFLFGQEEMAQIKKSISEKKNIIICGPTGSGKTSFLRSLCASIPNDEHLITIEDTYELNLHKENLSSFVTSNREVTSMSNYCSYAMRMKPDRIIIGEIRGKEIVPTLLAANSGHKGFLASLHANSAKDALSRLSLLFQIYSEISGVTYQQVYQLICQSIDQVIFMKNFQITEFIEIIGHEETTPYYRSLLGTNR